MCFLKAALPKLCKIVQSALYINCKYCYIKSTVLGCKCNVAIATHFWCRFIVANATSDNIVNATLQIYYQNDKKNDAVIATYFNVASASLCFLWFKWVGVYREGWAPEVALLAAVSHLLRENIADFFVSCTRFSNLVSLCESNIWF